MCKVLTIDFMQLYGDKVDVAPPHIESPVRARDFGKNRARESTQRVQQELIQGVSGDNNQNLARRSQ